MAMDVAERQPILADADPRCWRCDKQFARFLTRPWRVECPRCGALNQRLEPITPA